MAHIPPLRWFRKRYRRLRRRRKRYKRKHRHKSTAIMRRTHHATVAHLIHDAMLRLNRGKRTHLRAYNRTAIANNIAHYYKMKLGTLFLLRLDLSLKKLVYERKVTAEGNFMIGTVYKPSEKFIKQYKRLKVTKGFSKRRFGVHVERDRRKSRLKERVAKRLKEFVPRIVERAFRKDKRFGKRVLKKEKKLVKRVLKKEKKRVKRVFRKRKRHVKRVLKKEKRFAKRVLKKEKKLVKRILKKEKKSAKRVWKKEKKHVKRVVKKGKKILKRVHKKEKRLEKRVKKEEKRLVKRVHKKERKWKHLVKRVLKRRRRRHHRRGHGRKGIRQSLAGKIRRRLRPLRIRRLRAKRLVAFMFRRRKKGKRGKSRRKRRRKENKRRRRRSWRGIISRVTSFGRRRSRGKSEASSGVTKAGNTSMRLCPSSGNLSHDRINSSVALAASETRYVDVLSSELQPEVRRADATLSGAGESERNSDYMLIESVNGAGSEACEEEDSEVILEVNCGLSSRQSSSLRESHGQNLPGEQDGDATRTPRGCRSPKFESSPSPMRLSPASPTSSSRSRSRSAKSQCGEPNGIT